MYLAFIQKFPPEEFRPYTRHSNRSSKRIYVQIIVLISVRLDVWVCRLRWGRQVRRRFFLRCGPGRGGPPLQTRRESGERRRRRETYPVPLATQLRRSFLRGQRPAPVAPETRGSNDERALRNRGSHRRGRRKPASANTHVVARDSQDTLQAMGNAATDRPDRARAPGLELFVSRRSRPRSTCGLLREKTSTSPAYVRECEERANFLIRIRAPPRLSATHIRHRATCRHTRACLHTCGALVGSLFPALRRDRKSVV